MKLKTGFVLRDVCGQQSVMASGDSDIIFNRVLALSDSAAWLWQEAARQGTFTVQSLAAALCDEYDICPEDAKSDVAELIAAWKHEGVIEE